MLNIKELSFIRQLSIIRQNTVLWRANRQNCCTHLDEIEDPLYKIEDPEFYDVKISYFRTE